MSGEPRVVLDGTFVKVDPGSRATIGVRILNPTQVVENYVIDVVGECGPWTNASPGEVSVFPGDEASVEIAFEPPASNQVRAGRGPFGVRVRSTVDADNATVVEGEVEVGAFRNVTATIGPRTSKGRRSGHHHVEVSNWGNEEVTVVFDAADPDEELKFTLKPESIDLPVGRGVSVDVHVKAGRTVMRGAPQRKPFTVKVRREGFGPSEPGAVDIDLDANFEQRPLIPGWVMVLVPLIAIGIGAFVYFTNPNRNTSSEVGEAQPGAPATPTAFALAAGDDSLVATWEPTNGASAYELVPVDADNTDVAFEPIPVGGGDTTAFRFTADQAPPGEVACFRLRSINDAGHSGATDPQCATAPGSGSTTAGAGGGEGTTTTGGGDPEGGTTTSTGGSGSTNGGEDLGFIAIEQSFPVDDAGSTQRAQAERDRLRAAGIQEADILNSLDYDGVPDGLDGQGVLVVYVGHFGTEAAAQQFCTDNFQTTCLVVEPGPENPSSPAPTTTATTTG